ncbi:hypothetical protein [Hymenobacter negativus]|uniref:Uncharacterized protein n=1 Tax=Hymenobacter negativus TaxID=2795026 RepID=A0ABS3QMI3_9BACT|nr:hypothetical protein [Hymenobacter negativus]MBO2012306.1 hypothetical protein [Hymenobacter negativus]
MPVATHLRLFSSHLLPLLLVTAGLVSSCQTSRASFAFQPAPNRTPPVTTVVPAAATPDSAATTVAVAATSLGASHVPQTQGKARQPVHVTRIAAVAKAVFAPKVGHSKASSQRALLHRPHSTAEAGLGTTVLGVLGLVVLPIALIGLAISGGGLVWAIVAGAAALAVLVAYIDPFGR